MTPRNNIFFLLGIMLLAVAVTEVLTLTQLYRTTIEQKRGHLREMVQSHARLIESIARYNREAGRLPEDEVERATLWQVRQAHDRYVGFGQTGEFTLARRDGDKIAFQMSHRHYDRDEMKPVPFDSGRAEPMREALLGQSGTLIGRDYRGELVLAAYEPVAELRLGIVAKIDMDELRAPFYRTAIVSAGVGLAVTLLASLLFLKVSQPLVQKLHSTIRELQQALNSVKTLNGLLPICASCKKIRDDKGYWNQLESYLHAHSEAEFSHSLCPDCAKAYYADMKKELAAAKPLREIE